jgi:hypothetical protein
MAKQEQQLHVGQHAPNLVQIQRFLGSIDYPVDKEDLIEEVKKMRSRREHYLIPSAASRIEITIAQYLLLQDRIA